MERSLVVENHSELVFSITFQNVINPMERIVSTIVITALTRYVIDLTEVVYMVVLTGKLAI